MLKHAMKCHICCPPSKMLYFYMHGGPHLPLYLLQYFLAHPYIFMIEIRHTTIVILYFINGHRLNNHDLVLFRYFQIQQYMSIFETLK